MTKLRLSSAQWHARHVLHKQGVMGVTLATLLFLLGFSVPAWASQQGLWLDCSTGVCAHNLSSQSDVWMNATRVTECLALLAFVLCMLVEVLQDCFQSPMPWPCDRAVEALAFLAGILGISGAAVFGSQTLGDTPMPSTVPHQHDDHQSKLQWGFGLVVTASIIVLLSAAAIGYSRCRHGQTATYNVKASTVERGEKMMADDADSSAMMLVPAGHFDRASPPKKWEKDPPPYALPPPYPYSANCDFLLPIANSSMVPQITGVSSPSESSQVDQSQSFPSMDGEFGSSVHSFMSPVSPYHVSNKRLVMQPLFVKTDGGSEIEITPSAQNSSGLPSPYSHF